MGVGFSGGCWVAVGLEGEEGQVSLGVSDGWLLSICDGVWIAQATVASGASDSGETPLPLWGMVVGSCQYQWFPFLKAVIWRVSLARVRVFRETLAFWA